MTKINKMKTCSFCGLDENETLLIGQGLKSDVLICESCVVEFLKHTSFTTADPSKIPPDNFLFTQSELETLSKNTLFSDLKEFTPTTQNNTSNTAKQTRSNTNFLDTIKTPVDIKLYLDKYVIGQEFAKKILSVAVYNHYKRINQKEFLKKLSTKSNADLSDYAEVELEKNNVLLIGATGTGKTLLASTIAKLLDVPFTIVDATVFTESGYVGEDVESILSRLLQASNYDIEATQKGIVYIDEIDKIARKGGANPSITKDVGGEGVQQGMLKLLEGSKVLVPPEGGRKHPEQKMISINTQNILFICGGAFEGIDKIIARRINTNAIGFQNSSTNQNKTEDIKRFISVQDLRIFGLIPELLGRLPVLAFLNDLDAKTLKNILTKPKNALIKQYKKLFLLENIDFSIDEKALDYIVEKALDYKIGARGLKGICENILLDVMYDPSTFKSKKLNVDLNYVKNKIDNRITFLHTHKIDEKESIVSKAS